MPIIILPSVLLTMSESTLRVIGELQKPGVCFSCTFLPKSTADGCAVGLKNDKNLFVFNTTHNNDDQLVLLECFSVQEAGEYSVSVYEIHNGVLQEGIRRNLNNVTVSITQSECV